MFTIATLMAAGIGPTQARAFAPHLQDAADIFELTTAQRRAAFFAQYSYETGGFVHLEESLLYRDPLRIASVFRSAFRAEVNAMADRLRADNATLDAADAQARAARAVAGPYAGNPKALASRAYAGKLGNGDEASGDGWTFRGRGLPMLTGRQGYTAAAREMGEPYDKQPDLVSQPADAVLVGGWYWRRLRLNVLADASDIDGCTRMVNGSAMLGQKERAELFARALHVGI